MRRGGQAFLLASVAALVLVGVTAATPGDLDPSFDGDGIATTRFDRDYAAAYALVAQDDGKLVAAGYAYEYESDELDIALVRYNPDGSRDTGFGRNGKVRTDIGDGYQSAKALVVQADGKPVAAGTHTCCGDYRFTAFVLVRYNLDGTLDTRFDDDGIARAKIGNFSAAEALVLQADSKFVAAGTGDYDFGLVRLHPDGSLDKSFSRNGKVTTQILGRDYANALIVQADGKLVAAGRTQENDSTPLRFALVRYTPDGRLDKSFDGDGKLISIQGNAQALVVQEDGKLVAAGGGAGQFALVRYNPDGSLDTSFGDDGVVRTPIADNDGADALVVQNDGKLVAAGESENDFALVRYNPDGSLDTSFGGDGIVTTRIGHNDAADALVVQDDGKLVAGGYANKALALARYDS